MRALLFSTVVLLLVGCAGTPSNPDTCTKAVAAYQLYQASLTDGRVPSADERRIALAAAAFLQLNCGWTPAVPSAPVTVRGVKTVDVNGVPYLVP